MKIQFKWFDLWIGAYYDTKKRTWYICPIPTIVIIIPPRKKEQYGWRSVKDELPTEDAMYFVYAPSLDKDKPLRQCAWYNPKFGWSLLPQIWIDSITHWMPLPSEPDL